MTFYYYAGAQRLAMRQGSTFTWLFGDHLGSSSVTADANGENPVTQLYTAWGSVRWSSGSLPVKYTYTGQYSHTTEFGLLFYNARWYDPALGRWGQADTMIPGGQGAQAFDRYAYVNNSPRRYIDPNGPAPKFSKVRTRSPRSGRAGLTPGSSP